LEGYVGALGVVFFGLEQHDTCRGKRAIWLIGWRRGNGRAFPSMKTRKTGEAFTSPET
jgi:hypothetical protein